MEDVNNFLNRWNGRGVDFDLVSVSSAIPRGIAIVTSTANFMVNLCSSTFNTLLIIARPFSSSLIMYLGVFFSRHNHKIFDSIIIFNMVNMVNNLLRSKESPESFFHYQPVLGNMVIMGSRMMRLVNHYIGSFIGYASFPMIMIRSLIKGSGARIRTEPFDFSSPIFEPLFTKVTVSIPFPGLVITTSITKFSLLAWRSLKGSFTNFTDVKHIGNIQLSLNGVNI